jgi:hypothetical protein
MTSAGGWHLPAQRLEPGGCGLPFDVAQGTPSKAEGWSPCFPLPRASFLIH